MLTDKLVRMRILLVTFVVITIASMVMARQEKENIGLYMLYNIQVLAV